MFSENTMNDGISNMNGDSPNAAEWLEWQLERLVDGELPESERSVLLQELDSIPNGWKHCACEFLRSQCCREAMEEIFHTPSVAEMPRKDTLEDMRQGIFSESLKDIQEGLRWEGTTSVSPTEEQFADNGSFRQLVRQQLVRQQCAVATRVSAADRAASGENLPHHSPHPVSKKAPVVAAALREGGIVTAQGPFSSSVSALSDSSLLGEWRPADHSRSVDDGNVARRRRWTLSASGAFWGGTVAVVAISLLLSSLVVSYRGFMHPTQSANRNLPQSNAISSVVPLSPGPGTDVPTGRVTGTDSTGTTGTGLSEVATSQPDTANDGTQEPIDETVALALKSDVTFEWYQEGDTWKLEAYFDGEQNPESLQNELIFSDDHVAMLRAVGYEVEQQRDMVLHEELATTDDAGVAVSVIPISRAQIRYVGTDG